MRLTIICVGKQKETFIQEGVEKYLRYLRPYVDIVIRELKAEKIPDLKEAPAVRKREAERIFKTVSPGAYLVGLDERGEEFTSHEFAAFLNSNLEAGVREMTFIIGGAMGLDEKVTSRSNRLLALSRWTFTHEMARLVLLEQLYRAYTIIKGKTYHY
jgi:23S rRNA (pseudouridine1915-N3)-methyltransferase